MNRELILKLTAEFSENSPTNYLSPKAEDEKALNKLAENFNSNNFARNNYYGDDASGTALNKGKEKQYDGLRFYMPPILSVGSAADAGFEKLKDPAVVGPHHLMPEDWLPGAKSVISLFLPFSERVIESNTRDRNDPSMEWLFTRVDGQQHLLATGALVRDALIKEGYKAVVPYADDRFIMRVSPREKDIPIPPFSSNWSERHVGYITGIGTFGRSTNFISRRGACGRLISIVTDWETVPDEKDYSDIYGYCSECGVCYSACPGGALSADGKDFDKCSAFLGVIKKKFEPRYGCGKCQSGLPCSVRRLGNSKRNTPKDSI